MPDPVNNPAHYGGADNPYEAIKVIDAWRLSFCLGNVVKYIARSGGRRDPRTAVSQIRTHRLYPWRPLFLPNPHPALLRSRDFRSFDGAQTGAMQ